MGTIRKFVLGGLLVATALALGCASDPWRQVVDEDQLVSYRRYLNQYPDSKHADEARERIAFHELKREPSVEGYSQFREAYPQSQLAEGFRPELEALAFERARFAGTPDAYRAFLEKFPGGAFEKRAEGNIVFLEAGGFANGGRSLAHFAENHPESDYADDARLSAASLELRDQAHFERVGLVIRISPSTPEVQRIVAEFGKRAMKQYKEVGYELVNIPELQTAGQLEDMPSARLIIEHQEGAQKTRVSGGDFSRPGMVATTVVSLYASPEESDPIWQRQFVLRFDSQEHIAGTSMLFNPKSKRYWGQFFVPVASWSNRSAVRSPIEVEDEVVALDSVGDRVVLLQSTGSFDLLELASSAKALPLSHYERANDMTRWSGVRVLGDKVVIFGEDGLEVVGFGARGPVAELRLDRPKVGSVFEVRAMDDELLLASSRGLLVTDMEGKNVRRLLRQPLRGLARIGEALVFSDRETLYISTIPLIGQQRVMKKLKLGNQFAPGPIIGHEQSVIVIGGGGVLIVDLSDVKKPNVVARFERKQIGQVQDAAVVAGRIFLMGDRGLQLLDESKRKVVEAIDVGARPNVSRMGRFLVTGSGNELMLVDSAPFTTPMRASSRSSERSRAAAVAE